MPSSPILRAWRKTGLIGASLLVGDFPLWSLPLRHLQSSILPQSSRFAQLNCLRDVPKSPLLLISSLGTVGRHKFYLELDLLICTRMPPASALCRFAGYFSVRLNT